MADLNMADMFGKIQDMQAQMQRQQEALALQSVSTEVGGGMVKVTANGTGRVTAISVDRAAIGEDAELLEDLLVSGVNKALDEAGKLAQTEMQKGLSGMLPPRLRRLAVRSLIVVRRPWIVRG